MILTSTSTRDGMELIGGKVVTGNVELEVVVDFFGVNF